MAKMFKVAKGAKPEGKCPAMRCDSDSFNDPVEGNNPFRLCMQHHGQWHDCGRPDLSLPAEPAKRAPRGAGKAEPQAPAELVAELEAQRETARQNFMVIRERVQITEQSHMDAAGLVLKQVKEERKRLQGIMDAHIGPLEDNLRALKRFFKAPIEFYESAEKDIKEKIRQFELAQRAAQDAALASVQAAGLSKEIAAETTVSVAHGIQNLELPTGVSTRDVWGFRITDPSLVDRALCKPDEDLIKALVKSLDEDTRVRVMRECGGVLAPGIELVRDLTIVNNT